MGPVNRRILFARRPRGKPTADCFWLATSPLAPPAERQALVRNEYLSVDPYIRLRMEPRATFAPVMKLGDVIVGRTAGRVVESRLPGFEPGDWVVGRLGWQDFSLAGEGELQKIDISVAPPNVHLGCLGAPGQTAWIGLTEIGRPQPAETVLVSAACGAVGSVVGQLAKHAGCRVVGIAGSERKCALAREAFGFDACVDHRAPSFADALREAVPAGVDVYFDTVGGTVLDTVLTLLNHSARIPLCGLISQYDSAEPYALRNYREIFYRRATLRGFVLSDHRDRLPAATAALTEAYRAGWLRHRDSIVEGLEHAPEAFIAMLDGANIGKQLVRLRRDS